MATFINKRGGEPKATCYGNKYELKYTGKSTKIYWEAERLEDKKMHDLVTNPRKGRKKVKAVRINLSAYVW
jgi:hypothetical protein